MCFRVHSIYCTVFAVFRPGAIFCKFVQRSLNALFPLSLPRQLFGHLYQLAQVHFVFINTLTVGQKLVDSLVYLFKLLSVPFFPMLMPIAGISTDFSTINKENVAPNLRSQGQKTFL
jgi:hypothetical protein